ncbi:DUF3302 domain-containing protein [Bradyrhizobium sp. ma5]|uniref:DUF3302 domain-containing protein n=1 Tax=Bradyrhizobium sp. ma5 TaxID=3344828 RepID=UPI0035D4CF55
MKRTGWAGLLSVGLSATAAAADASSMDVTFGVLDAVTFMVFAVLIFVGVAIVASLGQLPGRLARKWEHPYAAAVSVAGWIGIATGGLLWPLALIWAFAAPSRTSSSINERQKTRDAGEPDSMALAASTAGGSAGGKSRP